MSPGRDRGSGTLNTVNVMIAVALHAVFFLLFWFYSVVNVRNEPTVIPIDLTVVVQENLDGDENEPPPLKPPEPEPEPEPVPSPPEPAPPPPEPEPKAEAVETIKEPEKKPEKKIEKPKPPEKPKKSAKELRKERLEAMRRRAKNVRRMPSTPQPNGRTEKKTLSDAEIKKLLDAGYRPGRATVLAASEEQRCLSLIRRAFESKWDKPPWTDTLGPMVLNVRFGGGGRIVAYNLEQSSGDRQADESILRAARTVGAVPGLSASFLEKYKDGIPVRFKVTRQ